MHPPDGTCPHNQDDFTCLDMQRILTPEDTSKRLHQGSHSRVHAIADGYHIPLPDRVSWDANIFSETAIGGHTDGIIVGTQVIVTGDALLPMPTPGIRGTKHPLTD